MSELAPDPHRQEQARQYARLNRRLLIIEVGVGAAFMLAFLLSGLSSGLRDALDVPHPARVMLYVVVIALGYGIVSSPAVIYRSYVLPHRFGLSSQSLRGWLADEAKAGTVGMVLGTSLAVAVYSLLEYFPGHWWLLAFAATAIVAVVMTRLAPILIVPLFFKLKPIPDSELRSRLLRLADRSSTSVGDVFQIDFSRKTPAGNAMVMGWGSTRRIALSDTLLERYTPEEIEVVMAHELGHHRHRDVARLIIVQSAFLLLGFYLADLTLRWAVPELGMESISDVAALPLLALVLAALALILAPAANAYARRLERAADRFALELTNNPGAFASMLTRLTDQNLAESQPGRLTEALFYDHPSYHKRLELARRFRSEERR
jgi:STE24 endopeptidase